LYCDEIEKSLAGAGGDTSGTSQDQLGTLLKVMQDENLPGIILLGHCGTGKSAIAKAAGTMANAPVIACDLGAMKGSLVGQSEQRIRAALDVFKAISQGKGIVIATCNKIASLPPELRRRFSLGIFMVDLPDPDEQATIWPMWIKKYGLDSKQPLPDGNEFTGAEIRACCDVAFRTGLSLTEASKFIVPVIKSAPDQVKALREQANGRYISASKPGVYEWPPKQTAGRKLSV
jgi:SpoVK/Ycf46/Vps4 family AAA+-type ATPase